MSYRDTMQVCMNGHVVTDRYNTSPEFRKNYCTSCGEKTVTKCLNCGANIPGDLIFESVVAIDNIAPTAPKICENCGKKFPWFDQVEKTEQKNREIREKEERERKIQKRLSGVEKIEIKVEGHGNVVNLGEIVDSVISNITELQHAGSNDIATAIEELTRAISEADKIDVNDKKEYLEQIDTLSQEALKKPNERLPKSILKPVINTLGSIERVANTWNTWGPIISDFFL